MQMLIDGKFVDSLSGSTMQICNPANGELVDTVPQGNEADVERALDVAIRAAKLCDDCRRTARVTS